MHNQWRQGWDPNLLEEWIELERSIRTEMDPLLALNGVTSITPEIGDDEDGMDVRFKCADQSGAVVLVFDVMKRTKVVEGRITYHNWLRVELVPFDYLKRYFNVPFSHPLERHGWYYDTKGERDALLVEIKGLLDRYFSERKSS